MGHFLFPKTFNASFTWSSHPGVILAVVGIVVVLLFGGLLMRKFK